MPNRFHETSFIAEFLHTVHPFNSLETKALHKLARKLEVAYYPQGKTILSSQPRPGLAVIRKGAVRLVDESHKFLDKRSEGELFGHAIYFRGEMKDYVVEAEEDCLIWLLNAEDFDTLRSENRLIGEYFSSHLKTRLSAATQVRFNVTQVRDVLKREPVSDGVLADAKAFTKGNLLMAAESPDNQMVRLAQNEYYFGRSIPIQSVIDNIDAVTAADLLCLAEDLWAGGNAALTMLGPGVDRTDLCGLLNL